MIFIIYIMSGIPGSGKSFYARNNLKHIPYLSRDIWRQRQRKQYNCTSYFFTSPHQEQKMWYDFIAQFIKNNYDTIIDQTTINFSSFNSLIKGMQQRDININNYFIYLIKMNTDISICKQRNNTRIDFEKVPDYVIDSMYEKFINDEIELYNNINLKNFIIKII